MYTPQYYYTPFRPGSQTDFQPVIPPELLKYFDIAERVTRFNFTESQANFIFQDTVAVHTIRTVNYLRNLRSPECINRDEVERMLWLHDLPEAVVNEERGSDFVTHEKNTDTALSESQENLEDAAGIEMFNTRDGELFQNTERAKYMIKNAEWSDLPHYKNALVAKIIDWLDRNFFTFLVTEWVTHGDYALHPVLPPLATFQLLFLGSYQAWMESFAKIEDAEYRDFMRGFIHHELYEYHIERWEPVIHLVPMEIQEMYREFAQSGKQYEERGSV